jgi:hypothetical protein
MKSASLISTVLLWSVVSSVGLGVEKTVSWKFDCVRTTPRRTTNILIETATLSLSGGNSITVNVLSESNCSGCRDSYTANLSPSSNANPIRRQIRYQTPHRKQAIFSGEAIVGGEIFYIDSQLLKGEPGNLVYVFNENNGSLTRAVLFCR